MILVCYCQVVGSLSNHNQDVEFLMLLSSFSTNLLHSLQIKCGMGMLMMQERGEWAGTGSYFRTPDLAY